MSQTLNSLPVGALVKDVNTTYNNAPIIWRILEHGHTGDPVGSTTLEARDILTLKCFDAKEPKNSDSNRKNYGNNRYLYSNLLQWLNSDAAAGEWYFAKHQYDNAPTTKNTDTSYNVYTNKAGFLNGFSTGLKNAMQTVSKTTAKNTISDGGGSENVESKVFLLSTTEVGLANENSIAEGIIYAYYSASNTNSRRQKYPTAEAVSESDYSGSNFNASSAWYWWLRTPYSRNACSAGSVDTNGTIINNGAFNGHYGASPAFCISSSSIVSDEPDVDGAYRLIYTQQIPIPTVSPTSYTYTGSEITPTITGYDSEKMTIGGQYTGVNAGSYSATFTLNDGYIWSDNTTETKTVIWSIDKAELEQPTVTGSFTYDEETHSPTIIGFDSSHMVQSGDTSGTSAGDYTLTISLSDSANYKFEDTDSMSLNFNWSIAKDIVNSPTVSGSYTYDGTEQEVTINGFDSTKMNKSGGLATNAGQYTVVISLIDSNNYSFSDESSTLSLTWTIEKANGFITLEKSSVSINATEFDTVDVVDSSGNVTVSSIDESIATSEIESNVITITGVDVGETSVTVSVSESLNYLSTSDTIDVTVNQAPIPPGPEPPTPSKDYKRYYARHEKSDGSYELKSYWTSSQTVEFEDGQTLEAYKTELSSDINHKGDNIDYSLDDGKIYLYSGDTEIAVEDMRIRVQPNIVLDDISNLSIRVSNGRVRFTWQDPSDVIFSELPLVEWAGTKVVRKIGSAPNDASDGTLVLDSKVRDQYASTPYFDSNLSSETYYYYRFFPYDKNGNYYGKTCAIIYVQAQLVAVDIPYVENTYAYTGSNITPSFVNFDSTKMTKSGATSAKNVGDYTITFTLRDGFKWSDNTTSPKDVTWSIDRATISTLPSAGSLTYNGSEQSPTWINYDNAKLEISGVTTGTNAGEYSAIFTPTDNYKWSDNTTSSKNIIWTISKANGYVELSDAEIDVPYGGTTTVTVIRASGTVTVIPSDVQKANASISGNTITITGVDESTTSCRVNVAESTNYLATYTTIVVTVGAPPMWKSTMIPYANENKQPIVEYNGEMHYTNGSKHYIWDGAEWRFGSYSLYNTQNESLVVYNNELHRLGGNNTNHYKYDGSEWINVGTTPLSDGLAVVYNECLYLFGDRYGYHYKWNGSSWEKLANAPFVINYISNAIVWNGELHILGGGSGGGSTKHYSWDGSTWTVCAALPYAFSYGSVAIIDNAIHIFGGPSSTNYRKHYYYNGTSWIQEPDICVDQSSVGKIITYKGSCYMMGGSNRNNLEPTMVRKFSADFSSYDVLSVVLPYRDNTSQAKTTTVHNNIIHIVLGNKNHYTFDGNTLTQVSTFPISNCEGRIVSYHNALHYICVSSSTTYHYKWENNEWINVGTPPVTINRYGGVFVYNDKIYAINATNGTFYSWNGISWTQETTGPSFSYGCSVLFNNKFYTFTPVSNATSYRYWDGNTWSTSKNISTNSMTGAVVLNDNLYLIATDSANHTTMYRYTDEQWIVNDDLSSYPLFDGSTPESSVVEYNNKLYMFGGKASGMYNSIGVYK